MRHTIGRIGARVRVSQLLDQSGRREELEGVVVSRQKDGLKVRLPDGTIRASFSDSGIHENHLRFN